MEHKASPASHYMRLYAEGVTLSVLLAIYYWQAAPIAALVYDILPAQDSAEGLPLILRATLALTLPALFVSIVLCAIWPAVRAYLPSSSDDEKTALTHFLYEHRQASSSIYIGIIATLVCAYNLFLLAPLYDIADYGTNFIRVLSPLLSLWGLAIFTVIVMIWDRCEARQFKSVIGILIFSLLGFPCMVAERVPSVAYGYDTLPYELTYLIVTKIPLVISMAIITDRFRRIDKRTGYFGMALSSFTITLLSSSLLTTNAIAMLICCIVFGLLRASGTTLRAMLCLHVLSQVAAYFIFKGHYLLHYTPTDLPHPFLYY